MLIFTTPLLLLGGLCSPTSIFAPLVPGAPQEATPTPSQEHPLEMEARTIAKIVDDFVAEKDHKIKTSTSMDGRVLLHTDYQSKREPKAVLENSIEFLKTMDWYLGPFKATGKERWTREDRPMQIILLREEESYHNLVDAIIAAAPRHRDSLTYSRDRNGFTLYPAKLRVYFRNVLLEGMIKLEHTIPHDLIHLEMHRRYGHLPKWMPEAVACAVEEQVLHSIKGDWYTDGMVLLTAHGGWRGTDTRKAMASGKLGQLYDYRYKPYDSELSHLAYGFAVYCLENRPGDFDQLCRAVQARYDEKPELGGLFELPKGELRKMTLEIFGPEFQDQMVEWWQKPPKRPKTNKPRKETGQH